MGDGTAFIRSVSLVPERVESFDAYPFSIPAVHALREADLELAPGVTFFVGENGSGKSTLVEAVAVAAGFNPEGGSTNFAFSTRASHSPLHEALRLVREAERPKTGFFLRAESFFNVATQVEEIDSEGGLGRKLIESYGGVSLHERSHGESFLALVNHRFGPNGLYILDEPEAALSVTGNLALLRRMAQLTEQGSQFLIASHSPILMGFPGARILQLGDAGFEPVAYEETEHYQLTRSFLEAPERFLRHLLAD
jgi:predicted ATPase